MKPGPFIVIGMGRSGTSYVGGVLHATGVNMGADLKPPDEHNPRGYFEDVATTRMHEHWLARRNLTLASISDLFPIDPSDGEKDELVRYVGSREDSGETWGVKAPGILFFWPAWWDAIPDTAVILFPYRHPAAVLASFERYGLDREEALQLWLQLNRLALSAVDDGRFEARLLDFDDRAVFARELRAALGTYVDTYEPQLVHHPSHEVPIRGEIGELYDELHRRTRAA